MNINSLKTMLKGWQPLELVWLSTATLIILILSIIWNDTYVSAISSITGIICVVLVAKGKMSNFYFGIIQALTYGYVAYTYGLYGESMLNILFYLPMQIIGIRAWIKNKKDSKEAVNGEEVYAKRLTKKQWLTLSPTIIVVSTIYALCLNYIGAQQVRLDSIAVVLSIFAQFLLMYRYAEQWVIWIIVNVLSIIMWIITLITQDGNDWSVLVMWIVFLVNSVLGYINWLKLSRYDNEHKKKNTK